MVVIDKSTFVQALTPIFLQYNHYPTQAPTSNLPHSDSGLLDPTMFWFTDRILDYCYN